MFEGWRRRSGEQWVKRTTLPPRSKPLAAGAPLSKGKALRRAAIVRTAALARTARAQRRKTAAGEFTVKSRGLLWHRFAGRCAYCGDQLPRKWWTAQHRRARGAGGSSDPATVLVTNGVAVHQVPCHEWIESNPVAAGVLGYRVHQHADPAHCPLTLWTGRRVYLTPDGGYAAADLEES